MVYISRPSVECRILDGTKKMCRKNIRPVQEFWAFFCETGRIILAERTRCAFSSCKVGVKTPLNPGLPGASRKKTVLFRAKSCWCRPFCVLDRPSLIREALVLESTGAQHRRRASRRLFQSGTVNSILRSLFLEGDKKT